MIYLLIVLGVITLCLNKNYRCFYIVYKTLPRDLKALARFGRVNLCLWFWEYQNKTVPKVFTSLVEKYPDQIVFYFEDEEWTYQKLEDFSNKIANYFKQHFVKGDTVALLLENRPEYVGIWLGLSKIGVVTALLNTNLSSEPLAHCIRVANCKGVIYGQNFQKAIKSAREDVLYYEFHPEGQDSVECLDFALNLNESLAKQSSLSPKHIIAYGNLKDNIVYIYTSGTTGLPKAAIISNIRFMFTALGIHFMANLKQSDVYYDPLPLYHSAGGMVGVGQAILFGIPVVLRTKFSASNYWTDCKKYNCTVAHYIGEICRYLLAVHKPNQQVEHSVKKIIGNGLRPQIWNQFVETFQIEEVFEFYGATEGNSNLVNIDSKLGAVGFVPRYASFVYPVTIIQCDEQTGEPIRNEQGFCTRCKIGEPGILLGKINRKRTLRDFAGYADRKATEKKVLQDVFVKGDTYFNSGDILLQDELGYFYFRDRTGDTFRWKGENVATSEVEAVISKVVGLNECVVYGVEVTGNEGRAGMMAIVDQKKTLDKAKLAQGLKANLPGYAVPLFLRILDSAPLTGTFKLKKIDLQKDGYDINRINDAVFFYDSKTVNYHPLTIETYNALLSGTIRV